MSSVVAVSVDWAFLSASRWSIRAFVSRRAVGLLGPHAVLEPKSSSIRTGILSRIAGRPRREQHSQPSGLSVVGRGKWQVLVDLSGMFWSIYLAVRRVWRQHFMNDELVVARVFEKHAI